MRDAGSVAVQYLVGSLQEQLHVATATVNCWCVVHPALVAALAMQCRNLAG
jgi:hypothetical protein